MRTHWKKLALLLAAVTAIAAGILFTMSSGPPEPTYQGRKLSDWIALYPTNEARKEALLHVGTNALPCLIKWACYTPPKWRLSLTRFGKDHPRLAFVADWASSYEYRGAYAVRALNQLGTNAFPALAQLNRTAGDTNHQAKADAASVCIVNILLGGIRSSDTVLNAAYKSPDPMVREAGTNAERVMAKPHAFFMPRYKQK